MNSGPLSRQSESDQEFCRELILRTRPNFSLSSLYVAGEASVRLVALYALFASLEDLLTHVTDEGVARTKLLWWATQLLSQEYPISDHPVIRHLRQTGAISPAATGYLQVLLHSTGQRMEYGSVVDESALKAICIGIALDQAKLELSLDGTLSISPCALENACAVMGLTQLLRETSGSQVADYSWVPLSILAQLDVNRPELAQNRDSKHVRELISRLCELGLNWLPAGCAVCRDPLFAASVPGADAKRHWLIQLSLSVRLLQKLRGKTMVGARRVFSRTTVGDALCAWRCARTSVR